MFFVHGKEIILRLLYVLISIIITWIIVYEYSFELLGLRTFGFSIKNFRLTNPLEILYSFVGLAFWVSLFISIPILYRQIICFSMPGLYKYEAQIIFVIFLIRVSIWFLSVAILFYILPYIWGFITSLLPTNIEIINLDLVPRLWEYLIVLKGIFKVINLLLYIPVFFFRFVSVQDLPLNWFLESRKITILICVARGALITPPDIFSQLIVAFFIIILREIIRLRLFFMKRYKIKDYERKRPLN